MQRERLVHHRRHAALGSLGLGAAEEIGPDSKGKAKRQQRRQQSRRSKSETHRSRGVMDSAKESVVISGRLFFTIVNSCMAESEASKLSKWMHLAGSEAVHRGVAKDVRRWLRSPRRAGGAWW